MKIVKMILLLALPIASINAMLPPKEQSSVSALLNKKMTIEGYLDNLKEEDYSLWLKVINLKTADYGGNPSLYAYLLHDIQEECNFIRRNTRMSRSLVNREIDIQDLDSIERNEINKYIEYIKEYKTASNVIKELIKKQINIWFYTLEEMMSRGNIGKAGAS